MRRVALAACVVVAAAASAGCGRGHTQAGLVPIRYSHYMMPEITVKAGEPVTITLQNDDPIEHEWIVGTADVHARHRTGTEPYHASIPTEVTIPALQTRVTTVTMREPGDYQYICHLPGHEQYGMVGTLHVVA